ncbi:MAG: hypothetical protein ACYDCH_09470 [Gaiellaceae bacterium]
MNVHKHRFKLLAVTLVALNAFFWIAQSGFALPKGLINDFFGARMIRAEVLVLAPDGSTQDYFIDQGQIMQVSFGTITLRERNGDIRSIPTSPSATVHLGQRIVPWRRLRPGLQVTVFHIGSAPASTIDVNGLGFR